MGDKIESHGQSGGITAKNVIVGEQNNVTTNLPTSKKRKNKLVKTVVLIIMLAASIVTVLAYINIKP